MFRLEYITGYDQEITQHYIADLAADVDDIPTTFLGYYKEDEDNFYEDAEFNDVSTGAINRLYFDINTETYFLFNSTQSEYIPQTQVNIADYARFGSSAVIIGDGTGLTVKMLNSKGSWKTI